MRKPNFFLIGAPKCGTTSWAAWLAEHPQIYFSQWKEPKYFDIDHENPARPTDRQYEALFRNASAAHPIVGEGSATYLSSLYAVERIEAYTNHLARYLVCLRNPVDMEQSLYAQQCIEQGKSFHDFEKVWRASVKLLQEQAGCSACEGSANIHVFCHLGRQMEALYRHVPRSRVHVVMLDDVKQDTRKQYLSVLAFLGLDDDGRVEFPVENSARAARIKWLGKLPQLLATLKARSGITTNFGVGVGRIINRINLKPQARQPISPELRAELQDYFREDILLLADLLGRDLSHWLAPPSAAQP